MKRKYNRSKTIVFTYPILNGVEVLNAITEKQLLKALKILLAEWKRNDNGGLCSTAQDLGMECKLPWKTVDCLRLYLRDKAPKTKWHGNFWWPMGIKEPRIRFLNARISELEISIKQHECNLEK